PLHLRQCAPGPRRPPSRRSRETRSQSRTGPSCANRGSGAASHLHPAEKRRHELDRVRHANSKDLSPWRTSSCDRRGSERPKERASQRCPRTGAQLGRPVACQRETEVEAAELGERTPTRSFATLTLALAPLANL